MLQRSLPALVNYMRLHGGKTAKRYSAEYGKTWTKEINPRTKQDIQLYGWLHNYPYHNQNDLAWWAGRRRPRHTIGNYAVGCKASSIFGSFLLDQQTAALHQLSLSGGTTLLLPTDKAFSDPLMIENLKSTADASKRFLFDHIIRGEMDIRGIAHRCKQSRSGTIGVQTIGGKTIPIRVVGSLEGGSREVFFGNGRVINHGIKCSNGVIFVLDSLV